MEEVGDCTSSLKDSSRSEREVRGPVAGIGMWKGEAQHQYNDEQIQDLHNCTATTTQYVCIQLYEECCSTLGELICKCLLLVLLI